MGNAQLATGWRGERPPGPCLAQPCAAVRGVVMATGILDDHADLIASDVSRANLIVGVPVFEMMRDAPALAAAPG
jgi:hypothetical protein